VDPDFRRDDGVVRRWDNGVAISRDEGKELIPAFAGMTNGKLDSGLRRNDT